MQVNRRRIASPKSADDEDNPTCNKKSISSGFTGTYIAPNYRLCVLEGELVFKLLTACCLLFLRHRALFHNTIKPSKRCDPEYASAFFPRVLRLWVVIALALTAVDRGV